MKRREFISVIGGVAVWPLVARAQQPATRPVIGVLNPSPAEMIVHPVFAAFRQGLADAGYVEGKNLAIEYRLTNYKPGLITEAARDLARLNVNVIFASTPEAIVAVRNATTNIPIVAMDLDSDPVAKGYVKSLARPGGNMTGVFLDIPELSGKQLGLLKEIEPRLSRIAILGVPGLNALQFEATKTMARASAIETEIMEVRVPDDFEQALEGARIKHVEAGILLSSPLVFNSSKLIGELALARRLPLISMFDEFPKNGGLIGYGPNVSQMWRRCGDYVGKILRGAKPSDLPIQRPERFDFVINLKTAEALGLSIPPVMLATAEEVIE